MASELRASVYRVISVGGDGPLDSAVDWLIMSLIMLSVLGVVVGTVEPFADRNRQLLRIVQVGSVAVFTVEYLARLWSCTADPRYADPVVGRLRFAAQPMLLVDLLAILPFYIVFLPIDLRFLRALRLVRFLRLFKLARYSASLQTLGHVVRSKKEDLIITMSATSILLVVSSSLMYYFERAAQPDTFSSIPASFWWGVVTLTTVGYGDVYPVTPTGRFFGATIAFLGVGLFALPASILASGFIEEATGSDREWEYCPHCGEELD